jgi:hypothetical protein
MSETIIRHRLEVYRQQTEPLIDFYRESTAVGISGRQPDDGGCLRCPKESGNGVVARVGYARYNYQFVLRETSACLSKT